jgi:hypothetical protein
MAGIAGLGFWQGSQARFWQGLYFGRACRAGFLARLAGLVILERLASSLLEKLAGSLISRDGFFGKLALCQAGFWT